MTTLVEEMATAMEGYVTRREQAQAALDCVRRVFDFGGENDAFYNLEGALDDLKRQGADPICIRTIERVQEQIAALSHLDQADSGSEANPHAP
jgi:hypothetical protein